ncbi:hypothetical protein [Amycolatopsis benzoatilytica]|uniref:hypothetical protein n=1 Tax=Amycolatopsis benzoatilytica TaxID=346045 RepID=UPI000550F834|nr:hypothetical protein [Amycolatopsis benzoatilytica]
MRSKRLLAGLAAVAVLVAGCGVRPSGVIPGGDAPSGPAAPGPSTATLYFVLNGTVVPVPRDGIGAAPADRVRLLAAGPTDAERATGYTTEVPPLGAPMAISGFTAHLGIDVRTLSPNAVTQIVCTILAAGSDAGSGTVVLTGGGQETGPRTCTT